jgi:hypothetical protein
MVGTSDGGGSWSSVTAETTNEDGSVSCLSASVCVATTDNGLWVTADGGRRLTITGARFSGATKVVFGPPTSRHPGTGLKVLSATRLAVVTPAGTGAGYVTVSTARGGPSALTGRAVYNFLPRPTVTGLSPGSGPAGGGALVTITGTGFGYVRAVHFGGAPATQLQVLSSRKLTVVAPPGAGTVNVTVTTLGGTSATGPAGQYAY